MRFISFKPFDAVLTRLTGDHWKHVRNTLSPTFSSGKLKRVCTLTVLEILLAHTLLYLSNYVDKGEHNAVTHSSLDLYLLIGWYISI